MTDLKNISAAGAAWAKDADIVVIKWLAHDARILSHVGEELAVVAGDTFECVAEQADSFIRAGLAQAAGKQAAKVPSPSAPAPAATPAPAVTNANATATTTSST